MHDLVLFLFLKLLGEFHGGPVVRTLLPLLGAWGWSLIRELRSSKPHGVVTHKSLNMCACVCVCVCVWVYRISHTEKSCKICIFNMALKFFDISSIEWRGICLLPVESGQSCGCLGQKSITGVIQCGFWSQFIKCQGASAWFSWNDYSPKVSSGYSS